MSQKPTASNACRGSRSCAPRHQQQWPTFVRGAWRSARLCLAGLLIGAALWGVSSPALAACSAFAPASSATVDCTGANTQGVLANASTGVSVEVHAAASIIPALNGALDPSYSNFGINVGTGATITIDATGSVDTSARAQQSAIKLNSGSTLTINGTVKGDSGVVGALTSAAYGDFGGSTVTVGVTGQVISTQSTFGSAGLAGGLGNNIFQIDGFIQGLGSGASGIVVGSNDHVTLSATGHIQSLGTANGGGIYSLTASNVVVTTAAGSLIESHNASGVSGAIRLGAGANVTAAGAIHGYPGSGSGIQVGNASTVSLKSTGSIVLDAPPGAFTVGGSGITAGNGSTVTVDGTISTAQGSGVHVGDDSQLTINNNVTVANGTNGGAFGANFGIGSTVIVGQNATITSTGSGTSRSAAALGSLVSTSSADHTVTIDIFGRVQHTGTGTASAIYLEGANHTSSPALPVSVTANITIEQGGSLYSQSGAAYFDRDGNGGYPDVDANIIIAGSVGTGVVGGNALDLSDGADTVTFLPTYALVGSLDGGSDQASVPEVEVDTLAFDGAAGTSGSFNFDTNHVVNFEAGHKSGAGTWTLNGTAGTGLTGTFAVDAGRLAVNGTMTSTTFTVNSGGELGGTGTLGATTILAGGTHAPGNSIGTETINGNYTNHGTLSVEVSPTDADKVVVNGAVDIAGAHLVLTEAPTTGWSLTHDYTIIDNDAADAVTGTFADITDNFAFLDPTVVYTGGTGNDVVLTLVRNALAFSSLALTPNEHAAATGIEALGAGNSVYDAILPLSTSTAPVAFDQLSGEAYASLGNLFVDQSRVPRDAALDQVDADFAALAAAGPHRPGRNLWTRVKGDIGVISGDGNAAAASFGDSSLLAGGDMWINDRLLVGIEGGVTVSSLSIPDRSSEASVDAVHAGLYGGLDLNPLQLSFGASLSGQGAHVTRTPQFSSFSQTLSADTATLTAQLFGEIGYAFRLDEVTIKPFASLTLIHSMGGSYGETGGSAALSGSMSSVDAAQFTVGVKSSADFVLPGNMKSRVSALVGWEQVAGTTPTATHAFAGGTPFTVQGVSPNGGALALGGEFDVALSPGVNLTANYDGRFGAQSHQALTATLSGHF